MSKKATIEMIVRRATIREMYFIARLENIRTKVPIKVGREGSHKNALYAREIFMGYA